MIFKYHYYDLIGYYNPINYGMIYGKYNRKPIWIKDHLVIPVKVSLFKRIKMLFH